MRHCEVIVAGYLGRFGVVVNNPWKERGEFSRLYVRFTGGRFGVISEIQRLLIPNV